MRSKIIRESLVNVFTGLMVNYPLSLLVLYLLLDVFEIQDTFWVGTIVTAVLTITAFIRVFWIRSYYENRNRSLYERYNSTK